MKSCFGLNRNLWFCCLFLVAFFLTSGVLRVSLSSAAEEIIIGGVFDLSGPASKYGIAMKRMLEMGTIEYNDKGGVKVGDKKYVFKSIVEDSGYVPDKALAASTKLVSQGVRFIIGLGSTDPVTQIPTEKAKALFFSTMSAEKILINKPYSFRSYATMTLNSVILMKYMASNLPPGQKVNVVMPDDATGKEIIVAWEKYASSFGFKELKIDLYPPKTMDFSPLIARVLTQKPDILVVRGIGSGAAFSKAALEQGFTGKFVIPSDFPPTWVDDVGPEKLGNGRLIGASPDLRSSQSPEKIRNISEKYFKTYKEEPFLFGTYPYNYLALIAQAISMAGTAQDTDKIRAVLEKGEFDLPWGKTKFGGQEIYGRPGDGFFPVYIVEYRHTEKAFKLLTHYRAIDAKDEYVKIFKAGSGTQTK
jgi:branched-chain amino acid transport system substrate-binding protein